MGCCRLERFDVESKEAGGVLRCFYFRGDGAVESAVAEAGVIFLECIKEVKGIIGDFASGCGEGEVFGDFFAQGRNLGSWEGAGGGGVHCWGWGSKLNTRD